MNNTLHTRSCSCALFPPQGGTHIPSALTTVDTPNATPGGGRWISCDGGRVGEVFFGPRKLIHTMNVLSTSQFSRRIRVSFFHDCVSLQLLYIARSNDSSAGRSLGRTKTRNAACPTKAGVILESWNIASRSRSFVSHYFRPDFWDVQHAWLVTRRGMSTNFNGSIIYISYMSLP